MFISRFSKEQMEAQDRLVEVVSNHEVSMGSYLTDYLFSHMSDIKKGVIPSDVILGDIIGTDAVLRFSKYHQERDEKYPDRKRCYSTNLLHMADFDWNKWTQMTYGVYDTPNLPINHEDAPITTRLWFWLFTQDFSAIKLREGFVSDLPIFGLARIMDEEVGSEDFRDLLIDSWADADYTEAKWFPRRLDLFRKHSNNIVTPKYGRK